MRTSVLDRTPSTHVFRHPFRLAFVFLSGLVSLAFAVVAATAWIVMLVLGALHHSVWESVPAIGFWNTVLMVFLLEVAVITTLVATLSDRR